jgi:hypothetical protein
MIICFAAEKSVELSQLDRKAQRIKFSDLLISFAAPREKGMSVKPLSINKALTDAVMVL